MEFRPGLIKSIGAVLTAALPPLIMQVPGALSSPVPRHLFLNLPQLRARNGWINAIARVRRILLVH
jgi:hypothetical protein